MRVRNKFCFGRWEENLIKGGNGMEKKNFGVALVLWFFLGGLGAHRIYIKESAITFLWYWLAVICSFGIIVFVDLFLLKGMIEKKHMDDKAKNLMQ